MELVGKPRLKTVRDVIKSLNPIDIDEIWIAVAYLNEGGLGYIRDLITKVKKTKIIVCLDPWVTDGESLEKLITISSVECHFYEPNDSAGYFHPKMFIFKHNNMEYSIILGSSNLTERGLIYNMEANLYYSDLLQSDAEQFIEFFNVSFKNSKLLTTDIIKKFKGARNKYIDHQRKWLSNVQRSRDRKLFSLSLERKLTSDQIDKIKRTMGKEKVNYINWFSSNNPCSDRVAYINNIKKYVSGKKWESLFDEIWSVGGLMRKYGSLGRSGISHHLVTNNSLPLIDMWVNFVSQKDWDEATNKRNSLKDIGEKIQSELFCTFHGDEFGIRNDKSIKALGYSIGDPHTNFSYKNYDDMSYAYFNSLLREIAQIYLDTIGRQCSATPLLLELDAFFWYLYSNKKN
ncbi:MAG: phospholipase D family protein [Thermotogae bacterium]|nr:phospholipase D family protein [Thermotogota bacterium]